MNIKYCQRRGDFSSLAAAVGGAFFAAITTFAISLQNGGILPAQLPLFGPNFHVFSETQTSAGVLFKAGEYNYVRCPGTVIPNIISTPYGSVYWANEMSATDGKYYFSPATITLFPQLGADNTLTEFAADTTYYIYTSQDLVFHCGDAPDPVCGNGLPEVGEGCDDGNDDNHDDCTNACAIATCGDNFVQGIETCDGTDDSACPNLCLLDCSCGHGAAVCGDGVREDPEDCDNGTANSDTVADACRTDCTDHRCGDNVTDSGEFCDDGNNVNNDACTNACTIATCGDNIKYGLEECDGTDDSACNGLCLADCSCGHGAAVCGDGVREDPEECDDNNTDDGDGCSSTCELEIPYSCDSCQLCGEGFFDNCEETECLALGPCVYTDFFFGSFCDPDPEVCNADPVCGNGVQEPGEECDDSNLIDGDGCSATCETEIPYSCDSCVLCGDGVFDDCEEAECLTLGPCTYLDIYFGGLCDRNPVICSEDPVCGDGVREDPEECDEGDDNSNTTVDACRTDCKNPRCGDGVKDTGEGCDDGNNVNNDDCTNAC
ncbi:hypothetical protein KKF03_04420, partial [Patescibacteria group bacterium]|nr:hypothetical protein [Patescibacteria group bacterium]